ncbi:hypothetical protein Dimus_027837 [Dionaea muscipula]
MSGAPANNEGLEAERSRSTSTPNLEHTAIGTGKPSIHPLNLRIKCLKTIVVAIIVMQGVKIEHATLFKIAASMPCLNVYLETKLVNLYCNCSDSVFMMSGALQIQFNSMPIMRSHCDLS